MEQNYRFKSPSLFNNTSGSSPKIGHSQKWLAVLLCVVSFVPLKGAAASFDNLGFDAANAEGLAPGNYPLGQLLPGWALFQGSTPLTRLDYNNPGKLASTIATLVSTPYDPIVAHIEGRYGLYLVTGDASQPFSLSQTGVVPENTSILSYNFRYASFTVSANGELLRPINGPDAASGVGYSPDPSTALFDVSGFAGQQVELTFTQIPIFPPFPGESSFIDSIEFRAIPEPGAIVLLGTGLIILAIGRLWWVGC